MKILIPIDGSANADRAVDYVIDFADQLKIAPEIYLINVQWKLALGNVKLFINHETVNEHYREQGELALEQARAKLEAKGFDYFYHISIGSPADAIVRFAEENQIVQIVMSANGQETLTNLLLGTVASKVVQLSRLPVLLVK
jgi:nucleotide-binding universal stress UspA family protein